MTVCLVQWWMFWTTVSVFGTDVIQIPVSRDFFWAIFRMTKAKLRQIVGRFQSNVWIDSHKN
jgi:hypothetical protein